MGFQIPSFAEMQFLGAYYETFIWIVALLPIAVLLIVLIASRRAQKSPLLGSLMAIGGFVLILPALILAIAIAISKSNPGQIFNETILGILVQFGVQFQPLAYLSIFGGLLALAGLTLYLMGIGSPRRSMISDPIYSGQSSGGDITINDTFSSTLPPTSIPMPTTQVTGAPLPQNIQNPGATNMNTAFLGQGDGGSSAGKTVILRTPPPVVKAWLMAREGTLAGHKFDITSDNVRVGRSSNNDIVIGDESISSDHARIKQEDGAYFIYDLASTNGTFKKSAAGEWLKIYRERIVDGDHVKLGQTILSFYEMPTATE